MASGTIVDFAATDKATYIKFDSGIMIAWGSESVPSGNTTGSTALMAYSGSKDVDVSALGFTSIIAAFANAVDSPAYWNANANIKSATVINLGLGGDNANGKTVRWFAIGKWS